MLRENFLNHIKFKDEHTEKFKEKIKNEIYTPKTGCWNGRKFI
jgi:hypothetical protein